MAVGTVWIASWGPINNPGAFQPNYWRIPFAGTPHILATAYLAEVSVGSLGDGIGGTAVASFKRFEFMDDDGFVQETEVTSVTSILEVSRCVSITVALDLVVATGMGGWTFYSLS
jgi:hypothetical protein